MPTVPQLSFLDDGKSCSTCGIWKPYSDYFNKSGRTDGKASQCKSCMSATIQAKYRADLEASRKYKSAKGHEYYHQDVEAYRAKNKEYYYATNKADKAREWRWKNPDKVKASNQRRLPYIRQWYTINHHLRRTIEGSFTVRQWNDLCSKYGNRCLMCGSRKPLTIDHIVPVTQGGTNHLWNIQPLCRRCNSRKNCRHINLRPDRLLPA